MSFSNNILLMSFSEKEGRGPLDIYVSFYQKGKWTVPKKLPFCTDRYDESSAFLSADNVTLYYSSDMPGGYGSNDIYMIRRLDDTWEKWSDPINLGKPINGPEWDSYFTIPASGDFFYIVKNGDIYKIKPKEEVKPKPVVLIRGKVINQKNNKLIGGANINYIDLETTQELGIAQSNEQTGEYTIILPYGKAYSFQAKAEGYYSVTENMDLRNLTEYKEINKDLYLAPIEKGQVIRLNNIFFEFNKAELKSESFYELDNLVQILKDNSKMEIQISGHTDNIGNDEYNLKLSKDRAVSVLNYLISKGIDAKRLSCEGYGETKPIADNNTEEGRVLNRRVEFTILKK
jgi:outer membrane protein OmpA-like peptidoglycan-associated protein